MEYCYGGFCKGSIVVIALLLRQHCSGDIAADAFLMHHCTSEGLCNFVIAALEL
jgi:hypothetical protein